MEPILPVVSSLALNLVLCTVTVLLLTQLEAKDVDYSTQSIKQLELMHKQETYPPRITMTFDTTLAPQQTLTVRVQVKGTYRDKQLSADLLLPFVDNSKCTLTVVSQANARCRLGIQDFGPHGHLSKTKLQYTIMQISVMLVL
jgi:hypothetical protein